MLTLTQIAMRMAEKTGGKCRVFFSNWTPFYF